jgi:DNA-binding NarL/FixJ family response regulator
VTGVDADLLQRVARLTPGEVDVLRAVADGDTNAEAAARLHISIDAVKSRMQSAAGKLGKSHRAAMVAMAFRGGAIR